MNLQFEQSLVGTASLSSSWLSAGVARRPGAGDIWKGPWPTSGPWGQEGWDSWEDSRGWDRWGSLGISRCIVPGRGACMSQRRTPQVCALKERTRKKRYYLQKKKKIKNKQKETTP